READAAYREAAARLVALGRDDTVRAQRLFNDWAIALWRAGRPLDAERVLRQAIAQGQHNGTETATQPALLSNYAFQLVELNRLEEAAGFAERAYASARAADDEVFVGYSLSVRATVYTMQGDLEHAAQTLSELEATLRRNVPVSHLMFAVLAAK